MRTSGWDAESISGVLRCESPANTSFVVLGEDVFYFNVDVGERVLHAVEEEKKSIDTNGALSCVVNLDVGREKLGNCGATAAIPDNFKPKPTQFARNRLCDILRENLCLRVWRFPSVWTGLMVASKGCAT